MIGDFGLVVGGAAGHEVDCYDLSLGTPANAKLLATSERLSDNYQRVVEEIYFTYPGTGGTQDPGVRADIVYFPIAGRRSGILHRFNCVVRKPLAQQLQQQCIAHHCQCSRTLYRRRAASPRIGANRKVPATAGGRGLTGSAKGQNISVPLRAFFPLCPSLLHCFRQTPSSLRRNSAGPPTCGFCADCTRLRSSRRGGFPVQLFRSLSEDTNSG